MNRIGFVFRVDPARLDDYRAHHRAVWPEMQAALSAHGWHNYSLFLRADGTLFGYFETEGTFQDALDGMATEDVNRRWQELMAPYFGGVAADTTMEQLDEVFHLP